MAREVDAMVMVEMVEMVRGEVAIAAIEEAGGEGGYRKSGHGGIGSGWEREREGGRRERGRYRGGMREGYESSE